MLTKEQAIIIRENDSEVQVSKNENDNTWHYYIGIRRNCNYELVYKSPESYTYRSIALSQGLGTLFKIKNSRNVDLEYGLAEITDHL